MNDREGFMDPITALWYLTRNAKWFQVEMRVSPVDPKTKQIVLVLDGKYNADRDEQELNDILDFWKLVHRNVVDFSAYLTGLRNEYQVGDAELRESLKRLREGQKHE